MMRSTMNSAIGVLMIGWVAAIGAGAGCTGDTSDGQSAAPITVTNPNVRTSEGSVDAVANHRLQAEPAVSYFLDASGTAFWIVCHNDTLHLGDKNPTASGVTCDAEDGSHQFTQHISVTGQAPWPAGDPSVSSDPVLVPDPEDHSTIWITASMKWASDAVGHRLSIGIGRLMRDGNTGVVKVFDGDLGPTRTAGITAILGSGVEGPANPGSDIGPSPVYPYLVIDPQRDAVTGLHPQHIVFLNEYWDGSVLRERIALTSRNMSTTYDWFNPIPVPSPSSGPSAWTAEADGGWHVVGNDGIRFWRPTLAINPVDHTMAAVFPRFVFKVNADGFTQNDGLVPSRMFYYLSHWDVYNDEFTVTNEVNPGGATEVASIRRGANGNQFSVLPYAQVVADHETTHWHVIYSQRQKDAGRTGWDVAHAEGNFDGSTWTNTTILTQAAGFQTTMFPALAWTQVTQQQVLTVGYLATDDTQEGKWRAYAQSSTDLGATWSAPVEVTANTAPDPEGLLDWEATPADGMLFGWNGFWSATPANGYFGYYSGMAAFRNQVFFAWTDCRRSNPQAGQRVIDVYGDRFTVP